MYVIVQHRISDPAKFWPDDVSQFATMIPPHLKLHQTFAGVDGLQAVCVWEAESLETLRGFLDPFTAGAAVNEYFPAVNREGVAIPTTRPATQRA